MAVKAWSNIEEVLFFKVIRQISRLHGQKIADFDQIERFRTVTPIWIHRWIWNDAQSLVKYRGGSLLFSKVIHQISRSQGKKNRRFWPEWSVSGVKLPFEFTDGIEMLHKAWCSIEEVPYYFSRSYIKFQGHRGCKNRWFGSNLSKITRPVAAMKFLRFALFENASEEWVEIWHDDVSWSSSEPITFWYWCILTTFRTD